MGRHEDIWHTELCHHAEDGGIPAVVALRLSVGIRGIGASEGSVDVSLGNVVDYSRPELLHCHPGYLRTEGVDAEHCIRLLSSHYRQGTPHSLHLFFCRHLCRSGPCGEGSDVYHAAALRHNLVGAVGDVAFRLLAASLIEGVWSGVQNSHHLRI